MHSTPTAGLDGPSRTIILDPVEEPTVIPEPHEREPEPVPVPEREPVPA